MSSSWLSNTWTMMRRVVPSSETCVSYSERLPTTSPLAAPAISVAASTRKVVNSGSPGTAESEEIKMNSVIVDRPPASGPERPPFPLPSSRSAKRCRSRFAARSNSSVLVGPSSPSKASGTSDMNDPSAATITSAKPSNVHHGRRALKLANEPGEIVISVVSSRCVGPLAYGDEPDLSPVFIKYLQ